LIFPGKCRIPAEGTEEKVAAMAYACRIKFCGLRAKPEIALAAELGVQAIGFVLTPSPRQVTPEQCLNLRGWVPTSIRVHGVFAHEDPQLIRRLQRECGLDVVQVHGPEEDPAYWDALAGLPLIRAFRVRGSDILSLLEPYRGQEFLLDAWVPGKAGGTGDRFDWNLARQASDYGQMILAGGLTPENVAEAIRVAQPWMVDVSSGIERERGVKDPDLMRAFVAAVRGAVPE
jgi:phosphoribosylanthranilate isomerase